MYQEQASSRDQDHSHKQKPRKTTTKQDNKSNMRILQGTEGCFGEIPNKCNKMTTLVLGCEEHELKEENVRCQINVD